MPSSRREREPDHDVAIAGHRSPLGQEVYRALMSAGLGTHVLDGRRPETSQASALVLVSDLALPAGYARSLQYRRQRPRLQSRAIGIAEQARETGMTTLVSLSSALICSGPPGGADGEARPADIPAEASAALAVEAAATRFSELGGQSVTLRLGWPYGAADPLTRQILAAGAKGWQMLDGPPGAFVPTIDIRDAGAAVIAALHVPAGVYDVTDGHPRTQGQLAKAIELGFGHVLHPLHDPRWGHGRIFGQSRYRDGASFPRASNWAPRIPDACDQLAGLCRARTAGPA
jgi:hypothetical protein